jgi:Subtilase family
MEKFAGFIRSYRDVTTDTYPNQTFPRIKVALIDDGVDGLNAELSRSIDAGQTFSERTKHNYNSYFTSSKGHGTIMAMLIRKICPNVRLYVAKLNEENTGRNTFSITASSAVKVWQNPRSFRRMFEKMCVLIPL